MISKALLFGVTGLAIVFGWYQLFRFSYTPGSQLAAPQKWPVGAPRIGDGKSPLLLVFVHPQCSCTRATLAQLDEIVDRSQTHVQIALAVYHSSALDGRVGTTEFVPSRWMRRQFSVVPDDKGALARRFGALTSGEAVLYSSDGRLLFQGGVTPERAHLGDSTGGSKLLTALRAGTAQGGWSSVFGCALFGPASGSGSETGKRPDATQGSAL